MKLPANPVDTSKMPLLVKHNKDISWDMKKYHFHQAYEIYYALSDQVKFFVSDKVYSVNRGDLAVFSPSDLHRSSAPENIVYERYVIYFDPDFAAGLSTPATNLLDCFLNRGEGFPPCVHLTDSQSEYLLQLIRRAEAFCSEDAYGSDIQRKIVLAEILLFVNSLYRTAPGALLQTAAPQINDRDFKKISPVFQYIQQHLDDDLSQTRLSREFYLSKSYLSTLFKKVSGFTINEYVIRRRILLAEDLLRKNKPVSEVCEKAGFNNLSHFIRTFGKMTGVSPKKYAKKALERKIPEVD